MRRTWIVVTTIALAAGMWGCTQKRGLTRFPIVPPIGPDYDRPLPPGELALREITDPDEIPDFRPAFGDRSHLREAVENSLDYLSRPSSKKHFPYGQIGHERAVASLHGFLAVLDGAEGTEQFDQLIRERFDVYVSVGCDDLGTVLFTGYYCPIFDARLEPDEQFGHPLYKLPPDLVRDTDTGRTQGRRRPDGTIVPYYTREQIERSESLSGNELVWLADEFEAYVVSVQGSGRLRLADGSIMEVGFAGDNGYDYVSVAEAMIEDGQLERSGLSLDAMIGYFKSNPHQLSAYLARNPRYIFFERVSGGPYGCLGVPVLPMRSIATDKDIYPRACLAYLQTTIAGRTAGGIEPVEYQGFALDQDRGNAILAAGRCDIFMGVGPEAGRIAGTSNAEGRLYYLFAK